MFSRCYQTLCFAILAALCGCGQPEPRDTPAEPEVQVTAADAAEQSIVVDESSADTLVKTASPTTDQEATNLETANLETTERNLVAAYQPPYPDRVDLFLAPKREGKRTSNDQEEAVELLGFVNVDRHRAVLLINGAVYPIAEGDSQFGVEVISIQPPAVVLQRGRQRWQASLEN